MRAKKNRSTSSLSWKSSNNTLLNTAQCFFYRSLGGGSKTINRDMIFLNCNSIHKYHHDRMCGTTHLSFHPCYHVNQGPNLLKWGSNLWQFRIPRQEHVLEHALYMKLFYQYTDAHSSAIVSLVKRCKSPLSTTVWSNVLLLYMFDI